MAPLIARAEVARDDLDRARALLDIEHGQEPYAGWEVRSPFHGWRLIAVPDGRSPHGSPSVVAVCGASAGDDFRVHGTDGWPRLVKNVVVEDAATARTLAEGHLLLRCLDGRLITVVECAADVPWVEPYSAVVAAQLEESQPIAAAHVRPVRVEQTPDGWLVDMTVVDQGDLVRHRFTVGRDASLTDDAETIARGLPVPTVV